MASTLEEYVERIRAFDGISIGRAGKDYEASWHTDDEPKIAIKQIRLYQKQLRALKKNVNLAMKEIRAEFKQAIAESTYQPGVGGMILGSKYRSSMRKSGASGKRRLRARRDDALQPYEEVKLIIDQLLDGMDMEKLQLEIQQKQ